MLIILNHNIYYFDNIIMSVANAQWVKKGFYGNKKFSFLKPCYVFKFDPKTFKPFLNGPEPPKLCSKYFFAKLFEYL